MKEKIKEIMQNVFELDGDIQDELMTSDCIEKWDSLGHMDLISCLEEEFDVELDEEDLEIMISLTNVLKVIEEKLESNG